MNNGRKTAAGNASHAPTTRQLLVVEPEELVRWSLVTYLGRWFVTFAVDSKADAVQILNDRRIDAVVVSDDLTDRAAEEIEAHARMRNPSVRVVRTVTSHSLERLTSFVTPAVEKPFELSKLADLLGVRNRSAKPRKE